VTTIELSSRATRVRQAHHGGNNRSPLHASDGTPELARGTIRQGEPVLLLTAHPGALSLISTFVEISGHEPVVPRDDEPIEQAVLRIMPRVSIVDFEHPGAASMRIEDQLTRSGSRVILFSTWYRSLEARARAMSMRALYFALPIEHGKFDALLQSALLV
jgi:DNA-binding response OmpR family regulator